MFKYMYIRIKLKDTKENKLRMERPTNFKQVKILTEKNSQSRMCQVYSTTTDGNFADLTTRHGRRTNIPFFFNKKAKLLVSFIRSTMAPLWEEKGKQREKKKDWIGSVIGISNSERLKYLKEIITRDEQSGQETWKFFADYSPAKNPNKSVSRLFSSFFVVGILDSKLLKYPKEGSALAGRRGGPIISSIDLFFDVHRFRTFSLRNRPRKSR